MDLKRGFKVALIYPDQLVDQIVKNGEKDKTNMRFSYLIDENETHWHSLRPAEAR